MKQRSPLKVDIRWFYYIARFWVRVGLFIGTRWQVKGRENVPPEGPLLIIANHLNLVDPPLVSVSINRKTMFMAKEELFRHKFFSYFIRGFGAFPVRRNQADREALRQSLKVLADGSALVIFPESTRSATGQMQPAFAGSALIALRSGAPILPIGIIGTEKLKGKLWPFRRHRVTVNIGKPFHLPADGNKTNSAELARLTDYIMKRIADLLPVTYHGHYVKEGIKAAGNETPVPSPLRREG